MYALVPIPPFCNCVIPTYGVLPYSIMYTVWSCIRTYSTWYALEVHLGQYMCTRREGGQLEEYECSSMMWGSFP
jgi:hypothetical protein